MNWFLAAIILLLIVNSLFSLYFYLVVSRTREQIASLFASDAPDKPAPVSSILDTFAHSAGRAIAEEVKVTIMGKLSGEARLAKAVEADIMQDAVQDKLPGFSSLLSASPHLSKRLFKNPALMGWLLQNIPSMFPKMAGGDKGSATSGSGGFKSNFNL